MSRLINILIVLAAVTFIVGIGIGYGYILKVFSAGTFWKFSIACLAFAVSLTLVQIRDQK